MADSLAFDDSLFEILKNCKTLPNFLNTIFGFLSRRTDFYYVTRDTNSPVGLPEGFAEQFVKNAFLKWKCVQNTAVCKKNSTAIESSPNITENNLNSNIDAILTSKVEENRILNIEESPVSIFSTSDSYNGAIFDNYSWSQSIKEVDITVKLPENVSTKNLLVAIFPRKVSVKLKNSDVVLLEGDLHQKVQHNESIWSLDGQKLEIHLEKASEMWWNCLIESEPKLDVATIDCSRPFEELSDEAQAKLQELTWNQGRKRLGLPTSDETALQEKLKKAWNVEGSPFQGEYDPNTVVFQ